MPESRPPTLVFMQEDDAHTFPIGTTVLLEGGLRAIVTGVDARGPGRRLLLTLPVLGTSQALTCKLWRRTEELTRAPLALGAIP